jgi:hypothetical protein
VNRTPKIEAIAVTDYYLTDTYESLKQREQCDLFRSTEYLRPENALRHKVIMATHVPV